MDGEARGGGVLFDGRRPLGVTEAALSIEYYCGPDVPPRNLRRMCCVVLPRSKLTVPCCAPPFILSCPSHLVPSPFLGAFLSCRVLQTSALDASGVDSAFQRILTEIYRLMSRKSIVANPNAGPNLTSVCMCVTCVNALLFAGGKQNVLCAAVVCIPYWWLFASLSRPRMVFTAVGSCWRVGWFD